MKLISASAPLDVKTILLKVLKMLQSKLYLFEDVDIYKLCMDMNVNSFSSYIILTADYL